MISGNSLNPDWIKSVSEKNRKTDRILIEKVIRAFLLLEGLAETGIPFIFKGGTAVMLLLNSSRRLSTDIDIIIEHKQDLNPHFSKVIDSKFFSRFELNERYPHHNIEKEHYKFFYNPVYRTSSAEEYILLDIVYEQPNYHNLLSYPINSTFLQQEGDPFNVQIASTDDLLGDKLTAFAPYTTGIPYEKKGNNMSMEIIKQLYDIGYLFDHMEDIEIVHHTFHKICETEITYRDIDIQIKEVLNDIYQTSLCLTSWGQDGHGVFQSLSDGIQKIRPYIFSETFYLEKAIAHAGKASYLSQLISKGIKDFERFENPLQIRDWSLRDCGLSMKIDKLKKSNPKAFFYWYKAFSI